MLFGKKKYVNQDPAIIAIIIVYKIIVKIQTVLNRGGGAGYQNDVYKSMSEKVYNRFIELCIPHYCGYLIHKIYINDPNLHAAILKNPMPIKNGILALLIMPVLDELTPLAERTLDVRKLFEHNLIHLAETEFQGNIKTLLASLEYNKEDSLAILKELSTNVDEIVKTVCIDAEIFYNSILNDDIMRSIDELHGYIYKTVVPLYEDR